MEWENKERTEQNMVSNQGTMNQPFYIPPPLNGNGFQPGTGGGYNPNYNNNFSPVNPDQDAFTGYDPNPINVNQPNGQYTRKFRPIINSL